MSKNGNREYDYDEIFEKKLKEMDEADRHYEEEIKNEIWSCKVGDLLELTAVIQFAAREDDSDNDTPFWPEVRPEGQIYRVADLKGRGFDLKLVSGAGPLEIRAMNSEIPGRFRVVPPPSAGGRRDGGGRG